jgi:hypothetical protein
VAYKILGLSELLLRRILFIFYIYSSAQKAASEKIAQPKTPTILSFNLEEQPPAVSASRKEQMKTWRDSVDGPAPTAKVPPSTPYADRSSMADTTPPPPPTGTLPDPTQAPPESSASLGAEIGRLTNAMSDRLDKWQEHQEKLSRKLIREVRAAVKLAPVPQPVPRQRDTIPPAQSKTAHVPPSIDIHVGTPSQGRPTRFYAVVRGRVTGILTEWREVLASISGFPNAKYKSFRDRPRAQEWYLQQLQLQGTIPLDQDLSDDTRSEGDTVIYDPRGLPPRARLSLGQQPITQPPDPYPTQNRARPSNADLVDFRMAGPDPSTGDPKKIHDVSINITSEVRNLLCPKGLTQDMQSRMLEVTPDVLTCQGKSSMVKAGSEFEVESMWNRYAGAMQDIAAVQAQRIGSQTRDTQWGLPSQNTLAKVKSLKDAMELADELASNRTSVLECAKSNYLEVLFAAGWTIEDAKIYCEQGGLIFLVTKTYDNLSALVQQIIGKAFQNPDQWSKIGQPRIDFHASQLGQFRAFSNRRELLLCRNYTYLRDGQSSSFQDTKLLSKLTEQLMEHIFRPEGSAKKIADVKAKYKCTHYHGNFHDGGSTGCDLKDLTTKVARAMAKKIDTKRIAAGETDRAKVIADVKEEG